jgi:hypothetical protein
VVPQNSKSDCNFKLKFGGSEQIGFFGGIKTMQNNANKTMQNNANKTMQNNAKIKELKELCEKTKEQNLAFLKSTKPFYVERYDYYEGKVDLINEIIKLLEENNEL